MSYSAPAAGLTPHEKRGFVLLAVAIVLVATLGVGVGYLLGIQKKPAPIIIEKCSDVSGSR